MVITKFLWRFILSHFCKFKIAVNKYGKQILGWQASIMDVIFMKNGDLFQVDLK